MAYYFYLGDMQVPVPPTRMTIKVNNKNKTVNLINEGEINIIKSPGLKEVSFDLLLPNQNYPFADYARTRLSMATSLLTGNSFSFQGADTFLETFQTAKTEKTPIRFIVSRMTANFRLLFDSNFLVTVEDFSVKEDAKNGYDLTVPLRLKEYRPYGTKTVEIVTDENGNQTLKINEPRQTDKITPKIWTITKEKSVYEAIKLASGGGLDWRAVANLNQIFCPTDLSKEVIRLG